MEACKVEYAFCKSYETADVRASLERILAPQTAAPGGSFSGKSLMMKPNWLAWRRANDIACVHPMIVVELAKLLKDAGAAKVTIMENPAVQTAPSIAKAMGIEDELKRLGVEVFNFSDYRRIGSANGARFHNIELANEHLSFDAMVNVAKAKTHAMMMLTLCVKNLFGLVKGSGRMGWHLSVGKDFPMFADMLLDIYLALRPRYNILDAVVCMEGNGPGSGDPVDGGFLAGCSDALALDASVSPALGVPDLLLLKRAEERKLIPDFVNGGEIPSIKPLKLPPPPGMLCEWGMPLPPFLKGAMRNFMVSRPELAPELCVGCGLCAKMCPPQSLKIAGGRPVFDLPNCIRCFCCQEHCPKGAITSRKTASMKIAEFFEDAMRSVFKRNSR